MAFCLPDLKSGRPTASAQSLLFRYSRYRKCDFTRLWYSKTETSIYNIGGGLRSISLGHKGRRERGEDYKNAHGGMGPRV